jgi:hypothetical protein
LAELEPFQTWVKSTGLRGLQGCGLGCGLRGLQGCGYSYSCENCGNGQRCVAQVVMQQVKVGFDEKVAEAEPCNDDNRSEENVGRVKGVKAGEFSFFISFSFKDPYIRAFWACFRVDRSDIG